MAKCSVEEPPSPSVSHLNISPPKDSLDCSVGPASPYTKSAFSSFTPSHLGNCNKPTNVEMKSPCSHPTLWLTDSTFTPTQHHADSSSCTYLWTGQSVHTNNFLGSGLNKFVCSGTTKIPSSSLWTEMSADISVMSSMGIVYYLEGAINKDWLNKYRRQERNRHWRKMFSGQPRK